MVLFNKNSKNLIRMEHFYITLFLSILIGFYLLNKKKDLLISEFILVVLEKI